MRQILILVILGVLSVFTLLFGISCGTSSPGTSTPVQTGTNIEVIIEDLAFSPVTITIDAGTTVVWINQDFVNHTVTSRVGLFDSGILSRGASYSRTFTDVGEFEYYCTIHPDMVGQVIVK